MNHAVKEEILADAKEQTYLLYVEVEPQPPQDAGLVSFKQPDYGYVESLRNKISWFVPANNDMWPCNREDAIPTPISIGDTVYQGEEWVKLNDWLEKYSDEKVELLSYFGPTTQQQFKDNKSHIIQPPQTMPIELADKTFKVLGIEVELMPRHVASPDKPLADCDYRDLDEAWFWKYSLEAI